MSIKVEIFADTAVGLQRELECLAPLIRSAVDTQPYPDVEVSLRHVIKNTPMDVVRKIVDAYFDEQGFEVVLKAKQQPSEASTAPESGESGEQPTPSAESAPAPRKRGGRPALVDSATATQRLKGNGADVAPEVDPLGQVEEPARSPEVDMEFVLDTLGKKVADPKTKTPALSFATRQAKENGTDKLTKLTADKFPAIRAAMEKEFPEWLTFPNTGSGAGRSP